MYEYHGLKVSPDKKQAFSSKEADASQDWALTRLANVFRV
jgi:hypothetical protein